jgi:pilus assembly protein FimV
VYRGANIAMAPVLSALQLSVMRRDGRQFLHVISTRPVTGDYLNLFLDVAEGSRRHVRAVTLWLTPDPQPAPPPAPPPSAAAPESAMPTAAPAAVPPAPAPPKPAVVAKPASVPAAAAVPKPAVAPVAKAAAAPLLEKARTSAPAACPQINPEQLRTCAALDYKNGVLQARIVELEEKVKALQVAIDGHADGAQPAVVRTASQPVMPKPKKKKAEPFPWLLAGGGAGGVALLAALVLFLRRKKARLQGEPVKPGLLARLKSRLKRPAKAAPAPIEPVAS